MRYTNRLLLLLLLHRSRQHNRVMTTTSLSFNYKFHAETNSQQTFIVGLRDPQQSKHRVGRHQLLNAVGSTLDQRSVRESSVDTERRKPESFVDVWRCNLAFGTRMDYAQKPHEKRERGLAECHTVAGHAILQWTTQFQTTRKWVSEQFLNSTNWLTEWGLTAHAVTYTTIHRQNVTLSQNHILILHLIL